MKSFIEYIRENASANATKAFHTTKGWKGKATQLPDNDGELKNAAEFFKSDKSKLHEDPMIDFRQKVDAMKLVPTRSGSKGDEE